MNQEYQQIILSSNPNYHFDSEIWNKEVEKNNYEIIVKDGFAILINYTKKFIFKVGYSRGGIRFDKNLKTFEQYKEFVEYLVGELKKRKYTFLGIDHVEERNKFNEIFEKENFRAHPDGTAIVYPKENWIDKFNSKKRYDLTYAAKKNVEVKFFTKENINELNIDEFYKLVLESVARHNNAYSMPSKAQLERLFQSMKFILATALHENKMISFNLSLFNPSENIVERMYAGTNEDGMRLRAPSLIEVEMVEYLAKLRVKTYDLWVVKEGMGASEFKKSIADEVKEYAPYSVIKINKLFSSLYILLVKTAVFVKKVRD